jgi:chromosome segregation ATPase
MTSKADYFPRSSVMKTNRFLCAATLSMCLFAAGIAGCADKGYEKAAQTTAAIEAAKAEAINGQNQLNKTVSQLEALVNQPGQDLRPQFQAFASSVKDLNSAADKLHKRATSMDEKRSAWFTSWESELALIKNPDIQAAAQQRIQKAKEQYDQVANAYKDVQETWRPLRENLKDVEIALSNDLTQGGIDSAKTLLPQISSGQAATNASLDALVKHLSTASVEFSSKIAAASSGNDPVTPADRRP